MCNGMISLGKLYSLYVCMYVWNYLDHSPGGRDLRVAL